VLYRSGGMLPTDELEATVSAADLDAQARTVLEELLQRAQIERLAARSPILGRGADMYQYDLTVERGAERHHIMVAETAIPDDLRPLVRWLEKHGGRR
jgi:hypothetical protein